MISSIIIGLIVDFICLPNSYGNSFASSWMGFTIFLPLVLYFSLKILQRLPISNSNSQKNLKLLLPIAFALVVILVMVFTVSLYDFRGESDNMIYKFSLYDFRELIGSHSQENLYSILYLLGLFPAAIIGFIYGLFIAFNLENELPK